MSKFELNKLRLTLSEPMFLIHASGDWWLTTDYSVWWLTAQSGDWVDCTVRWLVTDCPVLSHLFFVTFVALFCDICILSHLSFAFLCFVIFVNCLFVFYHVYLLSFCITKYALRNSTYSFASFAWYYPPLSTESYQNLTNLSRMNMNVYIAV